jgi:hypothetical protein
MKRGDNGGQVRRRSHGQTGTGTGKQTGRQAVHKPDALT